MDRNMKVSSPFAAVRMVDMGEYGNMIVKEPIPKTLLLRRAQKQVGKALVLVVAAEQDILTTPATYRQLYEELNRRLAKYYYLMAGIGQR